MYMYILASLSIHKDIPNLHLNLLCSFELFLYWIDDALGLVVVDQRVEPATERAYALTALAEPTEAQGLRHRVPEPLQLVSG